MCPYLALHTTNIVELHNKGHMLFLIESVVALRRVVELELPESYVLVRSRNMSCLSIW